MSELIFWIGLAVLFGLLELASTGFFFIFLAGGALAAALFALFVPSPVLQAVIFLVASTLTLLFARPLLRGLLNVGDKPRKPSNVQALEDQEVLVLEDVDRFQGQVKVLSTGERWTARLQQEDSRVGEPVEAATGETVLKAGELAKVVGIEGSRLVIQPLHPAR